MPHFRLMISYDGTDFHGYAKQPDLRTVQGELERALIQVGGTAETVVAGRTDAGVHARSQVVSATISRDVKASRLQNALERLLPDDIGIREVAEADPGFSPRFDAVARTYRYFVLQTRWQDPFRRHTHWQIEGPLDMGRMNEGASHLVGDHDFASFCRAHEGRSTVREIFTAEWNTDAPKVLRFEVSGASYCHQMVRSIVAVLVNVGSGKLDPDDVVTIRDAKDRRAARGVAPPQGLYLWNVSY
ncbi:MAG: tRNA pseudouridine(38-40) synthase TruA [Acidimicrobiia bacterium]|nr:tRNA pseudouridine(38-40) synthase TruA [Acidimicrobiia bacterium]